MIRYDTKTRGTIRHDTIESRPARRQVVITCCELTGAWEGRWDPDTRHDERCDHNDITTTCRATLVESPTMMNEFERTRLDDPDRLVGLDLSLERLEREEEEKKKKKKTKTKTKTKMKRKSNAVTRRVWSCVKGKDPEGRARSSVRHDVTTIATK